MEIEEQAYLKGRALIAISLRSALRLGGSAVSKVSTLSNRSDAETQSRRGEDNQIKGPPPGANA